MLFGASLPAVTAVDNTAAVTAGKQKGKGGFLSGIGEILTAGVQGGLGYLSTLAQIDLLKSVQNGGVPADAINGGIVPQITQADVNRANAGSSMGLPSWAIPAGLGAFALILVLVLVKK